jgi:CBS domain-containing protein
MAEMGVRTKMIAKDVMSSPVTTIGENENVYKVAKLMNKQVIGCIIVTDRNQKPVGIITEHDLLNRVLSKNILPSKIKAAKVMSTPLITVPSDENLQEVARKMSKLNVRRLGVVYKGALMGIITSKDILAVMPELIEIMQERAKIERENSSEEDSEPNTLTGYCDHCGRWSDAMKESEGMLLCEECQTEMKDE